MLKIIAGEPMDFSDDLRERFISLVRLGGEVNERTLLTNVPTAKRLIFLWDDDILAGVAALKLPKLSYRAKFLERTGVNVPLDVYPYELGYVFVVKKKRKNGFAHELVKASVNGAESKGIFSTTRIDNYGMHRVLERSGFVKAGKPYSGRKKGEYIQLFLRPTPLTV